MIATERHNFAKQTVDDLYVMWLKRPHANRNKELWTCRCNLCNRECVKTGLQLIQKTKTPKCCDICRRRRHDYATGENEREFQPTAEYIIAACAEIRRGWSAKERASRGELRTEWEPMRASFHTSRTAYLD